MRLKLSSIPLIIFFYISYRKSTKRPRNEQVPAWNKFGNSWVSSGRDCAGAAEVPESATTKGACDPEGFEEAAHEACKIIKDRNGMWSMLTEIETMRKHNAQFGNLQVHLVVVNKVNITGNTSCGFGSSGWNKYSEIHSYSFQWELWLFTWTFCSVFFSSKFLTLRTLIAFMITMITVERWYLLLKSFINYTGYIIIIACYEP